ncbi:neurogenic locus notch homolog protein 3-like [Crassostrea angulata]|uniref:neurogenic locus notch homolog protein 3-like n=1 Tax=Magallana angulata TaxID=2784310 RepID=UPI0022B0FA32|nr:neurogenic locus notch homolog protein 3-like [Crassostrea angulata]
MQNATNEIHYKCKLLKVLIILLKCVIQAVLGRERNFISHETSSYSTMMLLQIGRWWWILYSFLVPCYGSLKPGFSQLQRGHRLDGKVIQSFTELSFLDCVIECLVTPRCKSVNYFKGANFCESNYDNQTTAETKYVEIAGWVYSDKEHWPKDLAGACSSSNCQLNETCKHKRYTEDTVFECVLSDCGIPDLKGIDLNTTRREDAIGIHRRIHASCADGYSQSGSGRLNCQSNGEWKYDIVCREDTDECQNDPCLNGATCTNTSGSFNCTCDAGWTGIVCDEDINECLDNPCQNGGTCSNSAGSFTCTCAGGFTGALCNEVLPNIALGKPAEQSSTLLDYNAADAVDGYNGTEFGVDKWCAHTDDGDTNPWWRVDLQAVYYITSVRILNRGRDQYGDLSYRLQDVTVTVGLTESDVSTPCGFFAGPGTASQLVVIDCPTSPQGRFVKISKTTEYLTLCEVDVFGVSV